MKTRAVTIRFHRLDALDNGSVVFQSDLGTVSLRVGPRTLHELGDPAMIVADLAVSGEWLDAFKYLREKNGGRR